MRQSPVYYIAPSAISITPNANESANDLAVYVARGTRIKVYAPVAGFDMDGTSYREWTLAGRNRRLNESAKPYTIYARLSKTDPSDTYLVFAPKTASGSSWIDKYPYITGSGMAPGTAGASTGDYWYVRIGEVSLPEEGKRTVTYDTGILGTEQYNTGWNLNPDRSTIHAMIVCTVDGEDSGPVPYVPWGKAMRLTAILVGAGQDTQVDAWTIVRNSGDAAADAAWPGQDRAEAFASSGTMLINHLRDDDDFRGMVSCMFTVTAYGKDKDGQTIVISSANVTAFAETNEKYELVLSTSVVRYTPPTNTYTPEDGVEVRIRAIDQKGDVEMLTLQQMSSLGLSAGFAQGGVAPWTALVFSSDTDGLARATVPTSAFTSQMNVSVRLLNIAGAELTTATIAYVRDGEDSREREWIYLRSETEIAFGDLQSEHPLPALIPGGEVEPTGAATGLDTNKDQDGWVPEGWWDEMQGVDDTYRYEYGAYRNFIYDSGEEGEETGGHWGEFSAPVIWASRGDDGVTYRCRWTLDGREAFQLVTSYKGVFRGTLPLVATLMKRSGIAAEEPVTATQTVITVVCEGVSFTKTVTAANPQFVISETQNAEMIPVLNNADLTAIDITFVTDGGESFSYSIPVIREADEDSMREAVEKYGSQMFLSKLFDDIAQGVIGLAKGAWFGTRKWFIDANGDANFHDTKVDGQLTADHAQSTHYTGDSMFDTGWLLQYIGGKAKLVVDQIVCRGKFVVNEIEDRIWTYSGGNLIFSAAGSTIFYVEYLDSEGTSMGYSYINSPWLLRNAPLLAGIIAWSKRKRVQRQLTAEEKARVSVFRCYETSDDGTMQTRNWWHVRDIARCQTLNRVKNKTVTSGGYSGALSNTVYARKVVGIGSKKIEFYSDDRIYDYVDLSFSDCDPQYNDWPAAGDVLVQCGNDTDEDRQGLTTIEVTGTQRGLKVWDGVAGYSMENKKRAFIGYDSTSRRALLEIFGDAYIGAMGQGASIHDGATYVRYNAQTKTLDIKAHITAASTIGDDDEALSAFIGDVKANDKRNLDEAKRAQGLAELFAGYSDDMTAWIRELTLDGVISPSDKKDLEVYFLGYSTYITTKEEADRYNLDTTAFTAAYNLAVATKDKYTAATPENIPVESDFQNIFDWFTAVKNMRNLVADTAKSLADTAQRTADSMGYLKLALQAKTQVTGGLMLTSIIALRQFVGAAGQEDDPTKYLTWAGMNGQYLSADSMAAWYGGEPYDIVRHPEYLDPVLYPNLRYAKGVIRMDGTGYFAGGNIVWEADGSGSVAGGNIEWDGNGELTVQGENVTAAHYYLPDGTEVTDILRMFELDTTTQPGTTLIKAKYGLYSVGDVSAMGQNSSGGGGGGGGASVLNELNDVTISSPADKQVLMYDAASAHWKNSLVTLVTSLDNLTDVDVDSPSDGQVLTWSASLSKWIASSSGGVDMTAVWNALAANTNQQINTSHLSDALNAYAYIQNGVIHIGESSITPSTSVAWSDITGKPETFTPSSHTHSKSDISDFGNYLPITGGTLTGALKVNATIFGYNYTNSNNAAAFIFDKPGNNYTGIGANAVNDQIYFGACDQNGTWISDYAQKWYFNGSIQSSGSLQAESVKIEHLNEINSQSGMLHLNYRVATNLSLVYGGGSVGIGTYNPSYKLHVDGTIYATGDVTAYSDGRQKEIVEDVRLSLEQIAEAPAVKFTWKDKRDEDVHVGTIAQYWQPILPEAVVNKDGNLGFNYGAAAMVSSSNIAREVLELRKMVIELKQEVERLKGN